ncbi:transmembrane protein 25 isoform X2 [Erythrolamprus reginae]|uniref:transmembrane protein 25 isoform X2 n=1 Tax=Erythrolamprus reginae TaxID=121349 RepID=UPI00396C2D7A
MDAAQSPAGRLLCPGPALRSPRRRRRGGSAPGSPPAAPLQLLLVALPFLLRRATPGAVATSETRIDGRALSVSSLREAESRAFTCLAATPNLTWYLNGVRQESGASGRPLAAAGDPSGQEASGTFVVTARRQDHRLDCAATEPATGRVSTASVLLNVQFQPEIVKVEADYRQASEPGLLLLLFVLVQANPPADVTWVDQDGQVTVNASRFLLLDAQTHPWLANHTVRVQLRSPPRNASLRASNGLGVASASVPLPGLLGTQFELPLVALVGAAAVALVILLSFGVLISWTLSQAAQKSAAMSCGRRKTACPGEAGPSPPTCSSMTSHRNQVVERRTHLQTKGKTLLQSPKTTQPLLNKAWTNFLPSDTFIELQV